MNRRTFGAAFAAGGTSLDLMRLGGALLVLASHAWILTGHSEDEPFARAMAHDIDGGGLAVAMFFVISGFLIARSAQSHPWRRFVSARVLRIYPAFAVVVLVQVFVFGPVATGVPIAAYLSGPETWAALVRSLLFSPPLGLPGVFAANPVPLAVNGSLWTLRIEVLCYAGALGMGSAGLLRPGLVLLPLGAGVLLVGATMAARAGGLPSVLATLKIVSIVDCVLHFLAGATLWVYRDWVPRRLWIAGTGVAALVAGAGTSVAPVVWHLVLPYLVLSLALSRPVFASPLRRLGDVSYGVYLYAFPVQQSVVAVFGPGIGPLGLVAVAAPVTLACAVLSRRWVEAPFLGMRRRGVAAPF